tara:strand:+ start:337 stop:642 length:306 start_codon:yes stop_codon:yes gene_type:complete
MQARNTDPKESHKAARRFCRTGLKARLLAVYVDSIEPLTDEQAASLADVRQGWKRTSELIRDGLLVAVGTAEGIAGTPVRKCKPTTEGCKMIADIQEGMMR